MPRRDYDEPRRYEHDHRARGTFGSAFGGSVGCIFGAVFAIGVLMLGSFALCAGGMSGCAAIQSEASKSREKYQRMQEEQQNRSQPTPPSMGAAPPASGQSAETPKPSPSVSDASRADFEREAAARRAARVGQRYALRTDDGKKIPVFIGDAKMLELFAATLDGTGESVLQGGLRDGSIFLVDQGTEVEVREIGTHTIDVIVRDGPHDRDMGRVVPSWLVPLPTLPASPPAEQRKSNNDGAPKTRQHLDPDDQPKTSLPKSDDTLPIKTVVPPKDGRVILAFNTKVLADYRDARTLHPDAAKEMVADKKVMIVTKPVRVRIEGVIDGNTFVRVLVGPNAGKLYIVQSKYVK